MDTRTFFASITLSLALAACGGTTAGNGDSQPAVEATSEAVTTTPVATSSTVDSDPLTATTMSPTTASTTQSVDEEVEDQGGREESRTEDSAPGEEVPTTEPGDTVTGEVPEAHLDAVLTDASSTTGVPITELSVLRAEYVEWSDGSLGCPEPGVVYTQAITPGYWVEIGAGERTLDYRLGENGFFKLCGGTTTPHGAGSTLPGGDS